MSGPLEGIRVVEMAEMEREYCGKLLADLGADVIKVEPPNGSPSRKQPPYLKEACNRETSLFFAFYNSNKRSVTLDINHPEGREPFSRLVYSADVLIDGFDPGIVESKFGSYEDLRKVKPDLVISSITGFGQWGPHSHYKAPDIVAFAMGGLMYVSGDPSLPPVQAPGNAASNMACINSAIGVLIALWGRLLSGCGDSIDVSAQEAIAVCEHVISRFSESGTPLKRSGSQHQTAVPGRIYKCKDGFVHILVSASQLGSWERLLKWLGHPPELLDDKWKQVAYRRVNAEVVDRIFADFIRNRSLNEVVQEAQEHHLPCMPVNTPSSFMKHPHNLSRNFSTRIEHPVLGKYESPGAPYRFYDTPALPGRPPLLGEHNWEIFVEELGFEPEKVAALMARNVS